MNFRGCNVVEDGDIFSASGNSQPKITQGEGSVDVLFLAPYVGTRRLDLGDVEIQPGGKWSGGV